MIRAILLSLALALAGCAPVSSIKLPQNLTEAQASAQAMINEANVLIAASANVVAQNVKDGVMTKPEAQASLDRLKAAARQVDEAQALVRAGSELAGDRARLVQKLVLSLHREVAARARRSP